MDWAVSSGKGPGDGIVVLQETVGCERMVASQVASETLGRPPSGGSWLCAGRNSGTRRSDEKEGLFREEIHCRESAGHLERQEGMGFSVLRGVGNFIG